jgi:hypothetical protein
MAVLAAVSMIFVIWPGAQTGSSFKSSASAQPNAEVASDAMPALVGEEAVDYLKQKGMYSSLAEAMAAARYGVYETRHTLYAEKGEQFYANNPAHSYSAFFSEEGMRLMMKEAEGIGPQVMMKLKQVGYGERLVEVGAGSLSVKGNRIEIQRQTGLASKKGIKEWYENSKDGLEQGFRLEERPGGSESGERLSLKLELSGSLKAVLSESGQSVRLLNKEGKEVISYSKLRTYDASGKELVSSMKVKGREIWLEVEDESAEYPIEIDPIFEEVAQVQKLTASDGAAGEHFGRAISISYGTVVVGANGDDSNKGAAYIFERNQGGADQWGEVKKLTASDGAAGDTFGSSVSITHDTVVVGADGDDDKGGSSGSAYIFERNQGGADQWGEVKKLTASDGAAGDNFGRSVSISCDTVVVGAFLDDDDGFTSGSAYIFERNQGGANNWGEVKKLTASDGASDDRFGESVSIDCDTVTVGARNNDDKGTNSGSAYIFERNHGGADQWGEVKKLTASDGTLADFFGVSVSISCDTVVIGAVGDDDNGGSSGSAYIFERNQGGANNWGEAKKLTASDGAVGDTFGSSVSISCDMVVVGANGDDDKGSASGSAYIFERNQGGADQWGEVKKLTASDGAAGDQFGNSVSISCDTVVVGAEFDDDNGSSSGSAYVFVNQCGDWVERDKATASDGAAGDQFGQSISISYDTVVVGARGDDDNGSQSGSAYIFERNQGGANLWGEVKKLTASDGEANDQFGWSVSISCDTVVVGAFFDDTQKGSAYIFERNQGGADQWGEVKKLTVSDGETFDQLGWSVSISCDTIVVGAIGDDFFKGAAYIFDRNEGGADQWGEVKKLTASDGAAGDHFGWSVSISDDTVVVGAFGDDDNGSVSGSAYIFERNQGGANNWGEVKKLTASDGEANDRFGYSVSISDDTVVVGARLDQDNGIGSGSAYIFERNQGGVDQWGEVKKLTASDGAGSDNFGFSVSISCDTVVVGAFQGDDSSKGAAYIFDRNVGGADQWGEVKKLTASDGALADSFGWSVSISCDTVVVGSPNDDDKGVNSGSVYIFTLECAAPSCELTCPTDITVNNDAGQCGAVVTFDPTVSGDCGTVTCSPPSGSFFPVGATAVNCESTTGSQCSFTVTVNDTEAPVVSCPSNIVKSNDANQCSAVVTFNATANDNCDGTITPICSPASGSIFPVGTTTIVCEATDSSNQTGSCSFTVTVEDQESPQITTHSSPIKLWPPNHSYHTVNIADCVTAVSDNCDSGLSINDVVISQVTSDEPDNGPDDGNTTNDIIIAADCMSVNLRAERQGTGNGRIYTITFQVTDSGGNTGTATCKVIVPVNKKGGAIDDGPANTVTSNCTVSAAHKHSEPSLPFLPGRRFVPYKIAGLHLRASSCV